MGPYLLVLPLPMEEEDVTQHGLIRPSPFMVDAYTGDAAASAMRQFNQLRMGRVTRVSETIQKALQQVEQWPLDGVQICYRPDGFIEVNPDTGEGLLPLDNIIARAPHSFAIEVPKEDV